MGHRGCLSFYTRALKPVSHAISWKPTGRPQQTLASDVSRSGTGLHSGTSTTARLLPAMAGEGRYFVSGPRRARIPATIDHAMDSPLCTTLCGDGARVRTVEHLLSALEACGVDNCRIEIEGGDEIPMLDGSAKGWVEAIEQAGLCAAEDSSGHNMDKLAPELHEPMYLRRNDSFVTAFPSSNVQITYGIDFPKVPAIGCQWFSCFLNASIYLKEIASSRTFCIYEEVERMRNAGLIQGGSAENAIVCSASAGWLNPPLRFHDEPCRHKVLDLVGDFSLFAQNGWSFAAY
ncbi:probable UDP-3-O-acyl-N-acetylglucosamine deacetylase 1, mitochondrial isoform X2 [Phoenix dactylifera]|uniref:UDP-3-O-acyl-N-acetylglucosamine deacetylase n=1 Tax=Phoenix dactylifera TaxID=42345 RepID=A0A8B7BM54_PHODC|nr:probable UDP-3-O-acyl-N-acetylglucosamine deacetylase 1, mitochondrial isoform X2 [Phoenix dactylifera]XP_008781362.1 probable UDP-3-O-acyl-N-acetylglucosamine deacetylase 1, mitochondrial isoform X2 [Phoenix dactylifera]